MATTSNRFDPQAPDKSSSATPMIKGVRTYAEEAELPLDLNDMPIDLLALGGKAEQISKEYQQKTVEQPLTTAYRAAQNMHAQGSKYLGNDYKGRSRLFVPKTRSAIRKNMATAAMALFATSDVVSVGAAYDDDPKQNATAAVLKALLGYRMGAGISANVGMPWFMIAMGAIHDSQLTGIILSKQFWQYEAVPTREVESVQLMDEDTGAPVFSVDEMGNQVPVMYERPKMRVVKDRPMIELCAIENCGIDPAAPWYAPAQLGRWFQMRYPMGLSDVRAMLKAGGKDGRDIGWIEVSDELLMKGRVDDDRSGVRRTREGAGSDRFEDGRGTNDLDIIWITENFMRISGIDYTWWSIGRHGFISKVRETIEAYPEFEGERPYTMGLSGVDPHRVFPMSPVSSWQPLQLELNDITNLRQDTLKRSIAPLTLVKRGRNVDRAALSRRGTPDAVVDVEDMADVEFMQTPGPTSASYTETSLVNSNFDELAGVFSTSSVQQSRQLNETVGGMKLMSGAANAVSEFDLRVFVETWVEPVVRQVLHLERAYESDVKVLQLAAAKARVVEKFNYMPGLSDFEAIELTMRVNVGIGALDPIQQMGKFKEAMTMLAPAFPAMAAQGIKPKYDEFITEIMGKAGYSEGRRFFEFGDPPEQQQDPELVMAMKEFEQKNKALELHLKEVMLQLRTEEKVEAAENLTQIEIAKIRAKTSIAQTLVGVEQGENVRAHEDQRTEVDRQHGEKTRQEDRFHKKEEGTAAHKNRIAEILATRVAKDGDKDGKGGGGGSPKASPSKEVAPARQEPGAGEHVRDQLMGQTVEALTKIMERLEALSTRGDSSDQALGAIAQHIAAPVNVIRHPQTNEIIGMRKGHNIQQIMRDKDGKRIVGAQQFQPSPTTPPQSGPH